LYIIIPPVSHVHIYPSSTLCDTINWQYR
jgi:hypothetical protein